MSSSPRLFRSHQCQLSAIVRAIASGEAGEITDVLAAVTPGGGKSLLPMIAASALLWAGIIDRVCLARTARLSASAGRGGLRRSGLEFLGHTATVSATEKTRSGNHSSASPLNGAQCFTRLLVPHCHMLRIRAPTSIRTWLIADCLVSSVARIGHVTLSNSGSRLPGMNLERDA